MDGLISTGKKIPNTILKIIFSNKKKIRLIFIHIFKHLIVDIRGFKISSERKSVTLLFFCRRF